MERLRNLDRYQRGILVVLCIMLVFFLVRYATVISKVGIEYEDAILCPVDDGVNTVYSGKINGREACFTITPDKTVTFTYADQIYGPYTAKEDPTAIPKKDDISAFLVGVELRDDDEIMFRGGILHQGDLIMLFDEDGNMDMNITVSTVNGVITDINGKPVDPMEPSVSTILELMGEPELIHKGHWAGWWFGLLLSVMTAVSIFFADELFRWNLSFQIRDAYYAEPSEWEIMSRYIGWTVLPIMTLVVYIMGLR